MDPIFDIIEDIGKNHKVLLTNPRRIVTIAEASVATEFGEKLIVFFDSRSNHGGAKSTVFAS